MPNIPGGFKIQKLIQLSNILLINVYEYVWYGYVCNYVTYLLKNVYKVQIL